MPGDAGAPLLGHSLSLFREPHFALRRYRELGPVSWVRAFGTRIVSAAGPDAAQEVLVNRDKAYSQAGWELFVGPFVNRGLMLLDGDEHLHHRRLMQEAFTATRIDGYLERVDALAKRVVPTWTPGAVYPQLHALTLQLATEVFMDAPAEESASLQKAFLATSQAGMAVLRRAVPGTRWAAGVRGRRVLEGFFRARVAERRRSTGTDLFTALCQARTDEGHMFTDDDVVNHMVFMMIAATDSVTTTLTSVLHQLGHHPDWQDEARAECLSVDPPTVPSLTAMTSLDLVVKESLRLVAPLPTLPRRTVRDTNLQGHFVPAGTLVFVTPGISHHLEECWTEPQRFDPRRFSEARREDKAHRFAWMPFGGGAHKCLGMHFGMHEVKVLLHAVLRTFRWEFPAGYELVWDTRAIPVPADDLPIALERL
ncbi:cytochrome P450 [Actinokineospora bangkokensis]|uniref:Cytochrome P450 n=1 Tax=Actinokineospora bangkokensis TaxID=1193682 RepID=A0A1Q9LSX0_9PSEU|nr:cytochrome P450 [Actinokineospora bangkokensis]